MGLGYWDYLLFKEIADKWSEEQAGRPNAFTSGEILQELVSSMILGDFEDATGASRVELFMHVNDGAHEEAWQPFTRQDFLGVIACWASTDNEDKNRVIVLDGIEFPPEALKPEHRLAACGTPLEATEQEKSEGKFQIPDPLPWEEAKTKVPWENLAAVPLDRYPEDVQADYLKNFRISFDTFADWCTHQKLEQPSFWRGPLIASDAAPAKASQKRSRGRRARAQEAANAAFEDLYSVKIRGEPSKIIIEIPNKPWKTITAEVNDWLAKKEKPTISEDTVCRAAKSR